MTHKREHEFEGRERVSAALSRFFYFGNTRSVLRWFGFVESSTHAAFHLLIMALFLFGVMVNFDIYQDFENEHKKFGVYRAGTPFLLLFVSNLVCKLTFAAGKSGDKLLSFLMVDERIDAVEHHVMHLKYFFREFSSQLLKSRTFICGFGLFLVLFKVAVDIGRLSQQASPFYSLCTIAFWCYMCLSTVIANGFVYMTVMGCKIHVTIFKNSLIEQGNSAITLSRYLGRLSDFFGQFSKKFTCYFASQAVTCIIACYLVFQNMYTTYVHRRQGDFMIAAVDILCYIVVEVPMFLSIRCVLNDISSETETIRTLAAEKIEQISQISSNEQLISDWEIVGGYISHHRRVPVFYSSSRFYLRMVLYLVVLPLGIATISILGELTAYLLQWLPKSIF